MPIAVYALTAGAFGIGTTEFVIMGLLLQVSADLGVSVTTAGMLISGYALGVFVGAPVLTLATRRLPRKTVLIALMAVFTIGNVACALAPTYGLLMAARIVTSLAHGTFFGVGSVVATGLVPADRKASAIAIMFTGLTAATLIGVPFGAWLGLQYGWRTPFWAVAGLGVIAMAVLAVFVPSARERHVHTPLRQELKAVSATPVLLALLMTVLSSASVFAFLTYVQPILTQVAGFSEAAVSPILLLWGGGFAVGNILGGRLADRGLDRALVLTFSVLAAMFVATSFALETQITTLIFIALLGAAAFAVAPSLQTRVLEKAGSAGQNLASSLNIAAFNLGNAVGAWLGGVTIDYGPGLRAVPLTAAVVTALGLGLAVWSIRRERHPAFNPRLG